MARGKSNSDGWLIAGVVVLVLAILGVVAYFIFGTAAPTIDESGFGTEDETTSISDILNDVPIVGPLVADGADWVFDTINGLFEGW